MIQLKFNSENILGIIFNPDPFTPTPNPDPFLNYAYAKWSEKTIQIPFASEYDGIAIKYESRSYSQTEWLKKLQDGIDVSRFVEVVNGKAYYKNPNDN